MKGLILVVEDNKELMEITRWALEFAGYTVREATTGKEALTKVVEAPIPDLILLDLLLPDMSGFDVIDLLKKDPVSAASKIPVVVVSALGEASRDRLGQAQEVLNKPVNLQDLWKTIEKIIKESKG